VGLGRVDCQAKEWVSAAKGLFGDEIAVLVEGRLPTARIPPQLNRTLNPTHSNPRTIQPMW